MWLKWLKGAFDKSRVHDAVVPREEQETVQKPDWRVWDAASWASQRSFEWHCTSARRTRSPHPTGKQTTHEFPGEGDQCLSLVPSMVDGSVSSPRVLVVPSAKNCGNSSQFQLYLPKSVSTGIPVRQLTFKEAECPVDKLVLLGRLHHAAPVSTKSTHSGQYIDTVLLSQLSDANAAGHKTASAANASTAVDDDGSRATCLQLLHLEGQWEQLVGRGGCPMVGPRCVPQVLHPPHPVFPTLLQRQLTQRVAVTCQRPNHLHREKTVCAPHFWQVPLTLHLGVLNQVGDHDNGRGPFLPHHGPEVGHRVGQGSLGGDVGARLAPVATQVVGIDVLLLLLYATPQSHPAVFIWQYAPVSVLGPTASNFSSLRVVHRDVPELWVQGCHIGETSL